MSEVAPKFSILLPTRNRSFVVETAIQSVMNQSYVNWELIIVDNDVDDRTYQVVRKYIGGKVKYIRTGQMAMHANWQTGLNQATGEYITVLQDKAQYAPYALEVIEKHIRQHMDIRLFVWGFIFNEAQFSRYPEENIRTYRFTSGEVLQLFLNEEHSVINPVLPKMIFSCCHRSILVRCNQLNQDLFQPISPDYTSMYAQLSYFNELVCIETPLVHFNDEFSSGRMIRYKTEDSAVVRDFKELTLNGSIEGLYEGTSVNSDTQFNSILGDFYRIKSVFGGHLNQLEGNRMNVYREAVKQIFEMNALGVNTEVERKQIDEELAKQPKFVNQIVRDYEASLLVKHHAVQYEMASELVISILKFYLDSGKRVALWGAGATAKYFLSQLNSASVKVCYIVDSNADKYGSAICGVTIGAPELLNEEPVDLIFVSMASRWHEEVVAQIKSICEKVSILSPLNIEEFLGRYRLAHER
ncbi:glycosyltransferase [Cohnella lupini]|uniref:C-methyltransferase-like protein n=1 Tax=Cohnella lupini TaxID=1294267 RepID=A0A3D9I735_9BACL|nr:glycosyltransferase [Cohnella lupini]RED57578.1 C-methyltransferase-like protein [Cohnella lupini]